jgi:hypothetical protein
MTAANYLKEQLTGFVESYKKYFSRTFNVALLYTIICFLIATLLLKYGYFNKLTSKRQISLLSYFFVRYSYGDTYSIIDLTKTVYIFMISLFSIGMIRLTKDPAGQYSLKNFIKKLTAIDISFLLGTLAIATVADYIMFKSDSYSGVSIHNKAADLYIHNLIFQLRIYIPLMLFALTLWRLTTTKRSKLTFKRLVLLYVSLWLFNEFTYEVCMWMRVHFFELILIPFKYSDKYYLFESFLAIPLMAFFFLGYYSAMTTSLRLTESNKAILADTKDNSL